jgi:hypothetical protein
VELDGNRYSFDLGRRRREIFLQMGLDSQFTDLPVGQNQSTCPPQLEERRPKAAVNDEIR